MKPLIYFIIGTFINCLGFFSRKKAASLALRLFSTPMKGFIRKEQEEFLDSAFQEEFVYNNLPIITYRWPGNGKTIVLVHGWESNSARWENLINLLNKKNYNIIALDAPAHGNSGSKRFNAVLYSEFINIIVQRFKPDIVIAHSVGAMATMFAFEKNQYTSIEKVVLLSSPSEFQEILNRYVKMLFINRTVAKQLELLIKERFNKLPTEFSTAKSSCSISTEGLIIHDKGDAVIPYNDALKIKENFKNSTLITTENMGHSLNNDEVYNYVEEFLATKNVSLHYERTETAQ